MSNTEELEKMVLQFKVSDLQSLLGFAGQNKNGRKMDLQKKAIHLIKCRRSVPLEMKVRNIYRELVAENAANENEGDYFGSSFDKYNTYYPNNGYTSQTVSNSRYEPYNSRNYFSETSSHYLDMWSNFSTPTPKFNYLNGLDPNTRIPTADELKNVVFKKLSFFKFKSCIVPLTPIVPKTKNSELFEFTFTFSLNQQQQSLISWAKKSGSEWRYQVQLRLCLLDNGLDFSRNFEIGDSLPLALGVKISEKSCQLPPAIPSTNKQGMLLKRMDAPVNLSPQIRKNHANNLVVNWSIESNKLYGFTIHLVEKFTSDELINDLRSRGERNAEITKKYLNDKLNELCDDDIAATSLKVSLVCPLGKILMTLPVRANTCNHLQCFDGTLYIKMNEVKSTWQCPVCNQSCLYEDLFIDGYFAKILREERFSSGVTEIQIEADGSVIPVAPKKRSSPSTEISCSKKIRLEEEPCETSPCSVDKEESSPCENSLPSFIPIFNSYSPYHERNNCSDNTYTDQSKTVSETSSANFEQLKKNVVLVDLTDTDSEPESCPSIVPLNLKKNIESSASSILCGSSPKQSPPVYDIDL